MKYSLSSILFAAFAAFVLPAHAEVKTLTDVVGREVKVDVPAKRVALGFYYPDYLAVSGVEKFNDHVVGISREFWEKFNPGSWKLYTEKMPKLDKVADFGYINSGTFSLEKLMQLKPDVLVLSEWEYNSLGEEIKRIEAAGIPVVVVDFNAQTVKNHTDSVRLFGEISGENARAEKIANEYREGIEQLQTRIAKANLPKPKIYMEFGNKGPNEHSYTFGKNMWGAIVDTVGGENISAPFIKDWGQIQPEQVLVAKPDVIIISGTENGYAEKPEIMVMGIDISAAEANKRLAGFANRTGWQDLPAVKNQRLYGIYHTASRSISDLASAQFIAKVLYPDLFADINPDATYRAFHEQYLPIAPVGTFFLEPQAVQNETTK